MNTPGLTRLLLAASLALFAVVPVPGLIAETEEDRTRNRLEKLKQDMALVSEVLARDMEAHGSLRAALRKSEVAIGRIRKDIAETREKLAWAQDKLASLRAQREELLVARGEQQELIVREIQAAYQMGKQGQLKVLLNQESPDTLARSMAYYRYFFDARQERIESFLAIIERIDVLEPEIASTAVQLERTRATLAGQERQLVAQQEQRELDLQKLEQRIATNDERLQRMEQDREELERLLEVIEQAIVNLQLPREVEDFLALQGQMPWPVAGKPANRFGASRSGGKQRWQGLTIPAEEGSTVRAVHHGRVVFADWFRGSGLLLIIDHGEGYMSLYAHNQALLRDVGEWVNTGAPIATVGNTGGRREAALYFEIRQAGKPVDPKRWLARG